MNKKKIIVTLILILSCTMIFSSCGKPATNTKTQGEENDKGSSENSGGLNVSFSEEATF